MPFTRGHALLIGVGTYANIHHYDMVQTAADAEALAAVLRDPNRCGYPASQVHVLTGAQATLDAVRTALKELSTVQPHDTVVVCCAGHGLDDSDGNYCLTLHDSIKRGPHVLAGTGLAASELLAALRAIPAQRLLLLFNACYGGKLPPTVAGDLGATDRGYTPSAPPPDGDPLGMALSAGQGRILITACAPGETAQTGAGKLTLFGQAVVDALCGVSVHTTASTIGVFDLYQAVQTQVTAQAAALGKPQHPEITVMRGGGFFPLALRQGAPPSAGATGTRPAGDTYTQTVTGSGNAVAQGPGSSATVINHSAFNQTGQTVGTQHNYYGTQPSGPLPAAQPPAPEPRQPAPGQPSTADLAQLQAALQSAFTAGELERVVFFGLDTRLYDLTAPGPFPNVVLALVDWAARQSNIRRLVDAARKENPGNRALAACDAMFKAKGI